MGNDIECLNYSISYKTRIHGNTDELSRFPLPEAPGYVLCLRHCVGIEPDRVYHTQGKLDQVMDKTGSSLIQGGEVLHNSMAFMK